MRMINVANNNYEENTIGKSVGDGKNEVNKQQVNLKKKSFF